MTDQQSFEIKSLIDSLESELFTKSRFGFGKRVGKKSTIFLNPDYVSSQLTSLLVDKTFTLYNNPRFSLVRVLEIKLADDYCYSKSLSNLLKSLNSDSKVSYKNFLNPSIKLLPKKRYGIRIFRMNKNLYPRECIEFLSNFDDTIFVGPAGINPICKDLYNILGIGAEVISFDLKEKLYKDANDEIRLLLAQFNTIQPSLYLEYFEQDFQTGTYFIGYYELK